jgi:hypothetical protein
MLPLTTGLPTYYGTPSSGDDVDTMPGGNTSGSDPGWFFNPLFPLMGYGWTDKPVWYTRDRNQAIVFSLKLPLGSILDAVHISIRKQGSSPISTVDTLQLASWRGFLLNGSDDWAVNGATLDSTNGGLLVLKNLQKGMNANESYFLRVITANNFNFPETQNYIEAITNIEVVYLNPETNRIV